MYIIIPPDKIPIQIPIVEGEESWIIFVISRVWKVLTLINKLKTKIPHINLYPTGEYLLLNNEYIIINNLREFIDVYIIIGYNRLFGFDIIFSSFIRLKNDKDVLFKLIAILLVSTPPPFIIRRVYNKKKNFLFPIYKVLPIPGFLKILKFGRYILIEKFWKGIVKSTPTLLLPIIIFTDGFKLY